MGVAFRRLVALVEIEPASPNIMNIINYFMKGFVIEATPVSGDDSLELSEVELVD
jgi:hypothetical protein